MSWKRDDISLSPNNNKQCCWQKLSSFLKNIWTCKRSRLDRCMAMWSTGNTGYCEQHLDIFRLWSMCNVIQLGLNSNHRCKISVLHVVSIILLQFSSTFWLIIIQFITLKYISTVFTVETTLLSPGNSKLLPWRQFCPWYFWFKYSFMYTNAIMNAKLLGVVTRYISQIRVMFNTVYMLVILIFLIPGK